MVCTICNGKGYFTYSRGELELHEICPCQKPLTNQDKKRFVKDFSLPISIFRDDIFNYYIKELDEYFNTKEKLNLFKLWRARIEDPKEYLFNKLQAGIEKIKQTEEYNAFIKGTLPNPKIQLKQENIYNPDNCGFDILSIDLKKANYQALNTFLGTESYEDFLLRFFDITDEIEMEYFKQSKYIRQYIFGNLNPKRQVKLQKVMISEIAEYIMQFKEIEILSASSDEIVLKNYQNYKKEILEFLDKNYNGKINLNEFTLLQVDERYPFYYKMHHNGFKEIKNVPTPLWMQVYKKVYNKPLHEFDLKIIYNENNLKLIATLDEPLFKD
jgi:hypothetical protein